MDMDYLDVPEDQLHSLSKQLLMDLKEARERLKQNPDTNSRPPSSREPWKASEPRDVSPETGTPVAEEKQIESDLLPPASGERSAPAGGDVGSTKKARRQVGSQGYSCNLALAVAQTVSHHPACCKACGRPFAEGSDYWLREARYELELEVGSAEGPGLQVAHIRHDYLAATCRCGHETQARAGRCSDENDWSVALTEYHLCGPRLISLLVCLALSLRVPHRKIQVFLRDWLGIDLSTSTINQCIHEAGRSVVPVVDEQLVVELKACNLLHIDETPWKEVGQLLWLWVFVSKQTVVYQVGKRHHLVVQQLLGGGQRFSDD